MVEIGSDYYQIEKCNKKFFLSGRTAEEYIIRDILKTHEIKTVHMPSLCCHTMIEPFIRKGLHVSFYDVIYEDGLKAVLPDKQDHELLFYLDYFGYGRIAGLEKIKEWDLTLEDCTHSWLRRPCSEADYSFISYRKWTGFTAIAQAEKREKFDVEIPVKKNRKYETLRMEAMKLKENFIEHGVGNKEDYLKIFAQAEKLLESDYLGYRPSYDSLISLFEIDINYIKERRRKNAEALLNGIREIEDLVPMFPLLEESDVPLCVPVIVSNGQRDQLRKYLVKNQIYCPIHWPLSNMHNISMEAKQIYGQQLSLICDQRYSRDDMERQIEVIKNFYKNLRRNQFD